ncbi:haloacid dehalogenase-like hydrolase [Bradyrhizobium sp. Cham227]|nr:HAD family hydrolase [Bradyrhizobium brasilense]MCC8971868.1 haloacid dehalogenase-like hydrolase [Bradyrhizobium brasilense]
MLSAFATLSALPLISPTSVLAQLPTDPLASWNDTAPKKAILSFVERVTKQGSAEFVRPEERIATLDNDGTLWAEQPIYSQLLFALDRIKVLAPQHPEWRTAEPFASMLKSDVKGALAGGEPALMKIVAATHSDMSSAEFTQIVIDWIATARHPLTKRLYTEMVYQPMLELTAYLRSNGFKTFIVSGGGIDFMRPWTEKVYGKLNKALDAAPAAGWTVVDMKNDWKPIFPFGSK